MNANIVLQSELIAGSGMFLAALELLLLTCAWTGLCRTSRFLMLCHARLDRCLYGGSLCCDAQEAHEKVDSLRCHTERGAFARHGIGCSGLPVRSLMPVRRLSVSRLSPRLMNGAPRG